MTADLKGSASPWQRILDGAPGAIALIALVLLCYARTATFGYIWDDDAYVQNNQNLNTFAGLSRMWTHIGATPQYYPLTFTSFWIERQLLGPSEHAAAVSHLVNMLLHGCSVMLLWTILKRLNVSASWLVAAVFAVHPINIESVAWITERKNVLSMTFGLSALLIYLRYAGLIDSVRPLKPAKQTDKADEGVKMSLPDDPGRLYGLFLVLFICALLSKTTASVLPGVILVILWWKRGRIALRDVTPLIAPILLALLAGSLTAYVERDPYLVGAQGPDWDHSFAERLILAGRASWFYVVQTLLPHPFIIGIPKTARPDHIPATVLDLPLWIRNVVPWPLMFSYPRWTLSAASALQWLGVAGVLGAIGTAWALRHRFGRGVLACVLIYLGCLVPAMGFTNVYPMRFSFVADHFAYSASIALVALVAGIGTWVFAKRPSLGAAVAGVWLVWLIGVNWVYGATFRDINSIWEATLHRNERSWLAAANYGHQRLADARDAYNHDRIIMKEDAAFKAYVEALDNAAGWLARAAKLKSNNYEATFKLAQIEMEKKNPDAALKLAEESARQADAERNVAWIYPKFMIAEILQTKGQTEEARRIHESLLELQDKLGDKLPETFAKSHMRLAEIARTKIAGKIGADMPQADRDQLVDVINHYTAAIEIAPDMIAPKLQLAQILIATGEVQVAGQLLLDAITIDKTNPDVKYVSALALIKANDLDRAANQLDNLIKTNPRYLGAYLDFAEVLNRMNRRNEAIGQLELALRIDPSYEPAAKMLALFRESTTQPTTRPN